VVIAIENAGSDGVYMSHPAHTTGVVSTGFMHGRVCAVGITGLSYTAADTTLTTLAPYGLRIRGGDDVIGVNFYPGTKVVSVNTAGTTVTLSKPVLKTGTVATFTGDREPIQAYIDAIANGESTLTFVDVTDIKIGDMIVDPDGDIPANTYITAINTGTKVVDWSAATTNSVVRFFVERPKKVATGSAGATTVTVTEATGARIGAKVIGAVATDTYVSGVSGTTLTLTKPLPIALTSQTIQLGRSEIFLEGDVTSGSATLAMPYSASATEVENGMFIHGPGIPEGTTISGTSGSNLTLSKNAKATTTSYSGDFYLTKFPVWKGLSITTAGFAETALQF
jgi:hypothetical protein